MSAEKVRHMLLWVGEHGLNPLELDNMFGTNLHFKHKLACIKRFCCDRLPGSLGIGNAHRDPHGHYWSFIPIHTYYTPFALIHALHLRGLPLHIIKHVASVFKGPNLQEGWVEAVYQGLSGSPVAKLEGHMTNSQERKNGQTEAGTLPVIEEAFDESLASMAEDEEVLDVVLPSESMPIEYLADKQDLTVFQKPLVQEPLSMLATIPSTSPTSSTPLPPRLKSALKQPTSQNGIKLPNRDNSPDRNVSWGSTTMTAVEASSSSEDMTSLGPGQLLKTPTKSWRKSLKLKGPSTLGSFVKAASKTFERQSN